MPFLRVLELQVFLAVCDVCQDRWGKVPIVVAILARRLRRDPSQVRRALRELDAQGVFALSPGHKEGSYLVLCAAEETWRTVGARLEARWQGKRAVDGPEARDGAAAVLTPPPAAPPLPRRPPRRKKSGGAGGGDGDGPGLFQDRPDQAVSPPAVAPPPPPAPAPDPARAPTIPAPAPTEPTPPPSSPEPYYYPPNFASFLADHPDFFLDFGGTNPPVDAGKFVPPSAAPPILVCLDREKFLNQSSGSSDLDRNLPRPHACEAEGPDDDENDDDFDKSFEGDGEGDDGDEATIAEVPQLDHVGSLWIAFGHSFPGLNRATAAPRLAAILGWARSYEEARDYLREQIPSVTSDPKIRAPLAYLAHEPRFHTWREERKGGRSGRVVAFRRGGGGASPLSAVLGAVLGQQGGAQPAAPPPSPERAPLVPRLPPAAAEPYTRDPAWQARQVEQARQNAAAAAAGRAALVAAQKIPLTLAADHFGPGARGVRHDLGYAWAWSESEQS